MSKTLITLVGPTAIGKTSLGIDIAKHFDTEIISADSRQFFRETSIGTAKPTTLELNSAPHHFINILSIEEEYSAGKFEKEAIKCIDDVFKRRNQCVMVGGSGMYVNAVLFGLDDIPSDSQTREKLNKEYKLNGIKPLQEELLAKDPEHYRNSNIENPQRIIRALEVIRLTGKTYSSFRNLTTKKRSFDSIIIGLTSDRSIIYDRINKRVDMMVEEGLLEEAKKLYSKKHLNALNTVGYKEIFDHLDGKHSLEKAIELIKRNTRHFAKRQLTWFRKNPEIHWFDISKKDDIIPFLKDSLD